MNENSPQQAPLNDPPMPTISGKVVILAVFGFAAVMTAILWIYTVKHVGPFQPLRVILDREFPDSAPHVEGGQRKIHKETPPVLRVVMKVTFELNNNEEAALEHAEKVATVVRNNFDVSPYEALEIHLFKPEPEQQRQTWMTEIDLRGDAEAGGLENESVIEK